MAILSDFLKSWASWDDKKLFLAELRDSLCRKRSNFPHRSPPFLKLPMFFSNNERGSFCLINSIRKSLIWAAKILSPKQFTAWSHLLSRISSEKSPSWIWRSRRKWMRSNNGFRWFEKFTLVFLLFQLQINYFSVNFLNSIVELVENVDIYHL